MVRFNERYRVYGSSLDSHLLAYKEFLHSFLREDGAQDYINLHQKLFPGRYECYDVYVGSEFWVRIQVEQGEGDE